MAWDSVPWLVGGGAQHSPEVARLLAYAAMAGNEGVIGSGDLKVSALGTPGSAVNVAPGACGILCRATGQQYQMYAGRMATQDTVSIAATGSGSGRSDLVVARVEDPWLSGEPWPDPTTPATGPYIFTRVIPNVPSTTTTVTGLNLGYSAIPLARIDIPASTATITQAMIVDLRRIANPRRERRLFTASPTAEQNLTAASYAAWPSATSWSVAVPSWATQVKIAVTLASIQGLNANTYGTVRAKLGSLFTQHVVYDLDIASGGSVRTTLAVGDTLSVPSALRGTTQTLSMEGLRSSGTGNLQADLATTVIADVEFVEVAE